MAAITQKSLSPSQLATAMSGAVDISPQSKQLEANAHSQDVDMTVQKNNVDLTAKKAPLEYRLGYQSSSGRTVDYTSQLSDEKQKKLAEILEAYSPGDTNFSIDLTHLVDGNGYPLRGPVRKLGENGHPVVPLEWRDLKADLQTLRDIAQEANGPNKIHWNTYPEGWRAVAGHKPAFSLGHSERLHDLHFENEDLEHRIESVRTVQTPANGKTEEQMELEALEKTQVALARYHASLASMKFIKNALRHQIQHLETQQGPDVSARIGKLQKLLDQLPEAEVAENEKAHKAMHDNGQLTKRWVVLFGATHLPHLSPGEKVDLGKLEQDVREAVEKVPMKSKDGDGFLNGLPVQWFKNVSENNKETENRFIKSVVLLGAKDRATYEAWRRDRKAEETSDGPELFNVQLANVMATGKSVEEVEDFMHDSSLQIALSGLDEKDIPDCTKFIQERAGKWHTELHRVSEAFKKTADWQKMTTHELCNRFEQLIQTPT
jgi:hypothetical protein